MERVVRERKSEKREEDYEGSISSGKPRATLTSGYGALSSSSRI